MLDPAARRKFEALVSAAYIDGILAAPEREVLRRKASRMDIPSREMNEILALGEQRKLSVTVPGTATEREALLDDLIDVVAADGRVEAPEYHLLARFAETLPLSLPELRARVNRRLQARTQESPRRETVTSSPPRPRPAPPPAAEAPRFSADALPPVAPPTLSHAAPEFPKHVTVADLPPVTLQLIRQSISFDTESDSIQYIHRTLGVPEAEAADLRKKILAAFGKH